MKKIILSVVFTIGFGVHGFSTNKILIQTTVSGSTLVKDDNYYFKIVNG